MHPYLDLLQQPYPLFPQAADTAFQHSLLSPDSSNLHRPVLRSTLLRVRSTVTCNVYLKSKDVSSGWKLLLTRLPLAAGPSAARSWCWHETSFPPATLPWRAASFSAA